MQSNYLLCFLGPSSGELGLESFELGAVELLLLPAEPRLGPMITCAAGEGFELTGASAVARMFDAIDSLLSADSGEEAKRLSAAGGGFLAVASLGLLGNIGGEPKRLSAAGGGLLAVASLRLLGNIGEEGKRPSAAGGGLLAVSVFLSADSLL
ncbi:hypothetical protein F0562_025228 [Nyssa sinensis]|uniref:Uncharacterized protein n=1 Tax=Nyssa sinensis TaxID=561372 RepID=A0A5J5BDP0_9ASTE|nr:hypothetical protein F0562_025228 [Nyssa sinensis]